MPHDVDRTQMEYAGEASEYGETEYGETSELAGEQYEYEYEGEQEGNMLESIFGEAESEGSFEGEYQESQESPLAESMEAEQAAALLGARSDQEVEHFLGGLVSRITGQIMNRPHKMPVWRALRQILKVAAKKLIPIGDIGLGSRMGSVAGQAFGLEFEGLSAEDREFEAAKQFVRFAAQAARKAAAAPPHVDPDSAARGAVVDAAKKFAPGLLGATMPVLNRRRPPAGYPHPAYPGAADEPLPAKPYASKPACSCGGGSRCGYRCSGTWFRSGRNIILRGL